MSRAKGDKWLNDEIQQNNLSAIYDCLSDDDDDSPLFAQILRALAYVGEVSNRVVLLSYTQELKLLQILLEYSRIFDFTKAEYYDAYLEEAFAAFCRKKKEILNKPKDIPTKPKRRKKKGTKKTPKGHKKCPPRVEKGHKKEGNGQTSQPKKSSSEFSNGI